MKCTTQFFRLSFLSTLLCSSLLVAPVVNGADPAPAGLVVVSVVGASLYTEGTVASGTTAAVSPTIFGGIVSAAGVMSGECAAPNAASTCNSCAGGPGLKPCNPNSIHKALILRITMNSSTAATFSTGTPKARFKFGSTDVMQIPETTTTVPLLNQNFNIDIQWSKLCVLAGKPDTCLGDINGLPLSVGIDNNGDNTFEEKVDFVLTLRSIDTSTTAFDAYHPCPANTPPTAATEGICDFTVFPGDKKIYIIDFTPSANDLATESAGIKYKNMVLFASTDFATLTNQSRQFPLALINNAPEVPSLASRKLMGLDNDVQFCFALGNQDEAGNITYFTPASELLGTNPLKVKKYCATPSDVVGLLDDKHCFIATATFGSEMAPEVVTFRNFRNQFLMTNHWGRVFVKNYYKFGPVVAQWISESPVLKSVALVFLWPLLLFAKLSLAVGVIAALIAAGLIVLILAGTIQRTGRQILRRRSSAGEA